MSNISKEKKARILDLYEMGFKECPQCNRLLPIDQFYTINTKTNLLPVTRICKECNSTNLKIWYQRVKELARLRKERRRAK